MPSRRGMRRSSSRTSTPPARDDRERLVPVASLRDDPDLVAEPEQAADALPDEGLVVDDGDARHDAGVMAPGSSR